MGNRRKNNTDEERVLLQYENASLTADLTYKLWEVPAGRKFRLDRVTYVNPTGLAEDAANYFNVSVNNGATLAANWSTETGQEGTLAADTFVDLTLATAEADRIFAAGDELSAVFDETGTATLPAGQLVIEGRLL